MHKHTCNGTNTMPVNTVGTAQCIEERGPYTHAAVHTPVTRQDPDTTLHIGGAGRLCRKEKVQERVSADSRYNRLCMDLCKGES